MIGIVDIGLGNIRSVSTAVYNLGFDPVILTEPKFTDCTHVILPGVGYFGAAMERLHDGGWDCALRTWASDGKPLLGICLGMQLLASQGQEGGTRPGLGLIAGSVRRLQVAGRIPHVGWNNAHVLRQHPVFAKVKANRDFYFVHSYYFEAAAQSDVLCCTDYLGDFTSAVAKGSVLGLQFHPEKSQKNGLQLLENFCDWDGLC